MFGILVFLFDTSSIALLILGVIAIFKKTLVKRKYIYILLGIITISIIGMNVESDNKEKKELSSINQKLYDYYIEKDFKSLQSYSDEVYSKLDTLTPKEMLFLSYMYLCLSQQDDDFEDMLVSYVQVGTSLKESENPVLASNLTKFLDLLYKAYKASPSETDDFYKTKFASPEGWEIFKRNTIEKTDNYKLLKKYGVY